MGSRVKDFDFKQRTLESDEESVAVAWAENHGWIVRKMQYRGRRFARYSGGVEVRPDGQFHARLGQVQGSTLVSHSERRIISHED